MRRDVDFAGARGEPDAFAVNRNRPYGFVRARVSENHWPVSGHALAPAVFANASCSVPRLARSCHLNDRRRCMNLTSEDAEPSENRAAARNAAAISPPSRVTFDRFELSRILNLYGRMVADGEWRDYSIDFLRDRAVFSVFRRASEVPIYRIEKDPRLARKQGMYSVISATGLILRRGHELERVLLSIDRKPVLV